MYYMHTSCIFCKIVKKELPCSLIYEDADFLAFLDITPRVLGHTLLIPKTHYRWTYDLAQRAFTAYWSIALKITHAMQKTLSPRFVTYVTHGLEVAHAHIHLMPRKNETEFVPPPISVSKEEMEKIASRIQKAII